MTTTHKTSEELVDVTNSKAGTDPGITNGTMNGSHARPPKPIPFGGSGNSDKSREELRTEVHRRRMSLTPQEHEFLEHLVDTGNEIEVQLAKRKLQDENIFFEDRPISPSGDDSQGWGSEIDIGSEVSMRSLPDIVPGSFRSSGGSFHMSLRSGAGSPLFVPRGSEKHQHHLEERRKSEWARLWKAHENGLKLTRSSSERHLFKQQKRRASIAGPVSLRRAEIVRQSSILSSTTKELLLEGGPRHRPGEDEIFRGEGLNTISRQVIPRVRDGRGRATSWSNSGVYLPPMMLPPRHLRGKSEGSRKSVTFKADHELREINDVPSRVVELGEHARGTSVSSDISELTINEPTSSSGGAGSFGRLQTIPSEVAESVSTVPPLRLGHPVRSDSFSSIPSIHHAHPIRSDSMSSIPSIHHAHPIRMDSLTSIPSLHHAHHVHGDSNASLPSPNSASDSISSFQLEESSDKADAAWASPLPKNAEGRKQLLLPHPDQKKESPRKTILYRQASRSLDNGQGIEVSEINSVSEHQIETLSSARNFGSMVSFGDGTSTAAGSTVLSTSSFDDTTNRNNVFREIRTSLSDENLSTYFLGSSLALFKDSERSSAGLYPEKDEERDESWDMEDDASGNDGQHDAWDVLKKENTADYGSVMPFIILGTSGDDLAATPHVLSPPLMESLQNFLPYAVAEDNFWMKYSLLRDGASMHTMLQTIRGAKYTIIALETWDGEVFGSFTSEPWRKNWNYYGTGEAFLWRMRQSRKTFCDSIIDQAHMESELDVYPWIGENNCVQLCTSDMLAIGGGEPEDMDAQKSKDKPKKGPEYGFGLTIDNELLYGTSTHCATFGSPPLSQEHSDGSRFEIINLEVWTFTPCMRVEEAEKLELGRLFLENN